MSRRLSNNKHHAAAPPFAAIQPPTSMPTTTTTITTTALQSVSSNATHLTKKRKHKPDQDRTPRPHKKRPYTLQTVTRTMSVERAQMARTACLEQLSVQDQNIRHQLQEIRLLKQQLADTTRTRRSSSTTSTSRPVNPTTNSTTTDPEMRREMKQRLQQAMSLLHTAQTKKEQLSAVLLETSEQAVTDTDRILHKAAIRGSWSNEAFGRNAVHDMCWLCQTNQAQPQHLLQLVTSIGTANRGEPLQKGALQALMMNMPGFSPLQRALRIEALQTLCHHILHKPDLSQKTSPGLWILMAQAMDLITTTAADDDTSSSSTNLLDNTNLLVAGLQQTVEYMKHTKPVHSDGSYHAMSDTCPILDLLQPVWQALEPSSSHHSSSRPVAIQVKNLLVAELHKSVHTTSAAAPVVDDYSMPTEAAIAAAHGFYQVELFLRSSTETELALPHLTKAGRRAVHRMIQHQLSYGTVRHASHGVGRDRVLLLRKAHAEPVEQRQKREQRKLQHEQLLAQMGEYEKKKHTR